LRKRLVFGHGLILQNFLGEISVLGYALDPIVGAIAGMTSG
jgi:hypothetical protein